MLFFILTTLIASNAVLGQMPAPEANLVHALVSNYPSYLRNGGIPTLDSASTPVVKATLSLRGNPNIIDADGVMVVAAEFGMTWNDPFLKWPGSSVTEEMINANPEWADIKQVSIKPTHVWTPDILHKENSNDLSIISLEGLKSEILVRGENGTVEWKVMTVFKSRCQLFISTFPFDSQKCDLTFENVNGAEFDVQSGVEIPIEYDETVHDNAAIFNLKKYSWEISASRTRMNITLQLQRRYTYYLWNMLLPIALAASLQLSSYALPAQGTTRIVHAINCLLVFCFYLVSANAELPQTSQMVYLSFYAAAMIALCAVTCFYSGIICFYARPKHCYGSKEVLLMKQHYERVRKIDIVAFIVMCTLFGVAHLLCYQLMTN